MNREDEIRFEAVEYSAKNYYVDDLQDVSIECFMQGAKFADTHPISPWISVNSSKPKDYKELHRLFKGMLIRDDMCTVPVIARAVNGDKVIYIMAYMFLNKFTNLWEWVSLNKPIGKIYSITHWMPIPKLE